MNSKITKFISAFMGAFLLISGPAIAQAPIAAFSLAPNPVCSGQTVQVTDLSTGSPTAWSYTLSGFGPGGGTTNTAQNPVFTVNGQGTFTLTLIASNASGASAASIQTLQVLPSPAVNLSPATQTTCIGGSVRSVSVVAGGGPGGGNTTGFTYSWTTGATASVLSLPSQNSTTVITCVITSTNGCSTTRNATIDVAPATASITSNPVNICPGSNSTLTATGSGQGPFTYTWSNAATTRTTTASTSGVYNVTVTNSSGCTAVQSISLASSTTLQLNIATNSTLACAGNNVPLVASGAGSYTWNTGSTAANTVVTPSVTSTYTVVGTVGTCSGSAAITISVNTNPTISISASSTSVCSGSSATLLASGATTYTWAALQVSSASVVVSPSTVGTFTVRGQNPGCPIRTSTIALSILPAPTVLVVSSATSVCAGDEIALAASGANTYSWNNGSTLPIILVSPSVTTSYTVVGTGTNTCSNAAVYTQTVNACTGIEVARAETSLLSVFPVPANEVIHLTAPMAGRVNVVDVTGRVIVTLNLEKNTTTSFYTGNLSNGMYLLSFVESTGASHTKTIVVQH